MARNLENLTNEQAKASGWKIIKPFESEVVGKAVLETVDGYIMKSTKRLQVDGGWIYNTSTETKDGEGRISVAEALVFVPTK